LRVCFSPGSWPNGFHCYLEKKNTKMARQLKSARRADSTHKKLLKVESEGNPKKKQIDSRDELIAGQEKKEKFTQVPPACLE